MEKNNYDRENNQVSNDLIEKARQAAARSHQHAEEERNQARLEARRKKDFERQNLPLVSKKRLEDREKAESRQTRRSVSSSSKQSSRPRKAGSHNLNGQAAIRRDQVRHDHPARPKVKDQDFHKNIYGHILSIAIVLLSLMAIIMMWSYSLLPLGARTIASLSFLALSFLSYRLAGRGQVSKKVRKSWNSFATILAVFLLIFNYTIFSAVGFLNSLQIDSNLKHLIIDVNTGKEPFSVYISGLDTYGDISTESRSDVNIVMTVDPKDKEILLTNLPRDTYVEIYGTAGGYDKLTHAGIGGVETSIKTVSNFLNTDINYFAQVNFTSLIELVDVLGGIELDNPEAFPTNDGKYYFEAGRISLNGEEALAYSRERYNLAGGDIDRGKNQMRVIKAMVDKASSPQIIIHANELMQKFGDVAETNMPTRDISNLINVQLAKPGPWNFQQQTLLGYGRMDLPSYFMPNSALYMYEPDLDSITEIRENIENTMR